MQAEAKASNASNAWHGLRTSLGEENELESCITDACLNTVKD
jgi:hypothetical protein